MSQDEALRMTASVVDRFTGPLGALKKQMESLAREGGVHTDTLSKGFGRLESSAQSAEKAISSGLKPALGMVGITGLSAAAAITGIAASMRSFAAGAASLGALSRETGQTADNLRNFGAVASKFGIDQEAVAAGTKNFAGQMREFGRGIGETYQWLNRQGRDAAGRQHFQDFAADLRKTTDRGEQLRKVLREMENIQDPTERGMFAEKFFGSADFGKLGDKHFGPILEMWKKTAQKLGPLDPAAVKSAEDFERTMSELRTSMQKLGTTVGQEVLPYASQFTTWLSDIVGGQRNDAIKALREGIGEIRKELDGIDWKSAGEQAKEFLSGTITFAGDLVKALKAAALLLGALKDLKDGNVGEAFKKLGQADKATDLGLGQGRAPGTVQDSMRADTGPMMLRQAEIQRQLAILDENIARKESQPDPNGEGRIVDAEGRARRDRLTDETRKLADEIRRLREDPAKRSPTGDATAQPSAFGGDTSLSSLIHKASLGGLAGSAQVGRVLGGGAGIYAPSGDRLYGSGARAVARTFGGGPTTSIPDSVPMTADERNTLGLIMKYEGGGQNQMNYKGKALGLDPNTARGATAQGYFQMLNSNWRRIAPGLGIKTTNAMSSSLEDQTRVALHLLRHGGVGNWTNFNPRLRAAIARGEQAPAGGVPNVGPSGASEAASMTGGQSAPGQVKGTLEMEGVKYAFGSGGGHGASSIPFGSYPITPNTIGPWGRANGAIGINNNAIWDKSLGRMRQGIEIHQAHSAEMLSAGCIAIAGQQWKQFRAHALDMVKRHGEVMLNVDASGRATITPKNQSGPTASADGIKQIRPWQKAVADAAKGSDLPGVNSGSTKPEDQPVEHEATAYERWQARRDEEQKRRKGLQLGSAARAASRAGAGVAGAEGANGKLDVRVHNPGPGTHVTAHAKGAIFREIEHTRGRQMQPAGVDV